MSGSLTNVQQQEFDSLVKIEYRSAGWILRDTVRMRNDITGNTCQFRKVGQVIANAVAFQNTIAIQDPGFTSQIATLTKYSAACATDEIQDLTINFDSKQELAMVVAMAIGRRSDQIAIDSLIAGAAANVVAAAGTNLTYAKFRRVIRLFEENAVPHDNRFMMMSGNNLDALLADDHFTSRFYTSNDAVVDGTMQYKNVLSVNCRIIPTMSEGGIPLVGTVRRCVAWHKMAAGFAVGQDFRTEINYLPRETSWFVNGLFYAGAVVIDNRGTIRVDCDEAVNP